MNLLVGVRLHLFLHCSLDVGRGHEAKVRVGHCRHYG